MKNIFAYIRVSGKKQREGVSLPEQKRILLEYAQKHKLNIIRWFEETKTAAKRGRPEFTEMMKLLKKGKADGVVIHKIDRSARNLHDWAHIGDLIDNDIDVYFAHESLDMNERSGRLSADIQAVIASDYVRNLKQEITKGLYGRLQQGIFPFRAPIGYNDTGKGKVKTIDPVQGECVKELFELYLTGRYNVKTLAIEMNKRGMKNKLGNPIDKNTVCSILKNPFYIGLIKIKGQTFEGKHEPLIDLRTFQKVQEIIATKNNRTGGMKRFYTFKRLITCSCGYRLIGEHHKKHMYYRCQTKECPTKCIREDSINASFEHLIKSIKLSNRECGGIKTIFKERDEKYNAIREKSLQGINLQIKLQKNQEQKVLDTYLEGLIDKEMYLHRKEEIHLKIKEIESKKKKLNDSKSEVFEKLDNFLELAKSLKNIYNSANSEEKREIIENVTSNLSVEGKKLYFTMVSPYSELLKRGNLVECGANADNGRLKTFNVFQVANNVSILKQKPLSKKQLEKLVDILIERAHDFPEPYNPKKDHEIPKNYFRSKRST